MSGATEAGAKAGPQSSLIEVVLEAIPVPAWLCRSASWEIVHANTAATRALRTPLDELRGKSLQDRAPAGGGREALSAWPEPVGVNEIECRLWDASGRERCARLVSTPLGHAAPAQTLVVENVLRWSPALAAACDDDLLKVAKRESIELLAGGIAHDFNNLLTAMFGNLSLAMMDSSVPDNVLEWLRDAEKVAARARDLSQQLLAFAKGGEPVRKVVPVASLVRDAARFARHGSSVRCEFEFAPDLWPAEVDPGQISQVVHNLVLNAIQAQPRDGIIRVRARNLARTSPAPAELPVGNYIVVTVADRGPGIRPEHLASIFEPYFSTKPQGSGLGLATSRSIAQRHNGSLRVESILGQGATFILHLPAIPGAAAAEATQSASLGSLRGRVLFMDDEAVIRSLATKLLERLGLEAVVVEDGRRTIDEYQSARNAGRPFDLVVVDLTVVAGMGGHETLHHLLRIDPQARVIVSSGYGDDPLLRNHRSFGFHGAVTKPWTIDELGRALRASLPDPVATN